MSKIFDLMCAADRIHDQILGIAAPYVTAHLKLGFPNGSVYVKKVNYITEISKKAITISCDAVCGLQEFRDYEVHISGPILQLKEPDLDAYVQNFEKGEKIKKLEAEKMEIERKLKELM